MVYDTSAFPKANEAMLDALAAKLGVLIDLETTLTKDIAAMILALVKRNLDVLHKVHQVQIQNVVHYIRDQLENAGIREYKGVPPTVAERRAASSTGGSPNVV